ncbi:MAG: hypothetical protein Q8918_17715 [Bacteroidota bacterium]|nr:hypothetical protein [Bacteroidota bacterium]
MVCHLNRLTARQAHSIYDYIFYRTQKRYLCSDVFASTGIRPPVDIDPNDKVVKINADSDPGAYLNAGGGKSLVGYMDPDRKYTIGSIYHYYGEKDYFDSYPTINWFGITIFNPKDPNPEQ